MSQRVTPSAAARAASLAGGAPPAEPAASPVEPLVRGWLGVLLLAAEWILLFAAVGLWMSSKFYTPRMSVGGVLVAASWLARWARLGRLTRPTPLDIPLVLFLISAVVATLIAPDRTAALVRLYLLLAASALYYFLVNAEAGSLRLFAHLFSLFSAALALYFASQNDWTLFPAKFAAIGNLGKRLGELAPDLHSYKPHPNVVGGLLALAAPVALACCAGDLGAMRRGERPVWAAVLGLAIAGLGGLAILFGAIMAESRMSWLVLATAGAVAVWWWLAGVIGARSQRSSVGGQPSGRVFWLGIAFTAVAACSAVVARPQLLTAAFGYLPGPNSLVSRIEIYGQVWRLAQDTPFTGSGLDSFPAVYSTYVLSIPHLFLTHAHNAYLNLLVEQGWPGLIAYAGLVSAGLWAAARQVQQGDPALRPFTAAGALGLMMVALHSFGDGVLVASRATPALLIPAGLALAGWPSSTAASEVAPGGRRFLRLALAGLAAVAVVGAGWLFRDSVLAAWHANLGALAQQRVELAGWPAGQWDDGSHTALLAQAEPEFQKAVEYQPANRTARYRLGLIAVSRRDFAEAADQLQRAYQGDPSRRGVIKVLGFTYVWLGDYDSAAPLLARIPEAGAELSEYAWWWGTQGRSDLSQRAVQMASRLES